MDRYHAVSSSCHIFFAFDKIVKIRQIPCLSYFYRISSAVEMSEFVDMIAAEEGRSMIQETSWFGGNIQRST